MKSKLLCGVVLMSACVQPSFAATKMNLLDNYIGIEIIQTNQDYKPNFGRKVYKKNPTDYSVFTGLKFAEKFGVEAGCEFQPNKKNTANLVAGDSFPGRAATPAGSTAEVESSIKARHVYLGLFGEIKYQTKSINNLRFQALIAASLSSIKARDAQLSENGISLTSIEYADSIRIYSKTKVVPMAKLSMLADFTDHVGVRLSATYRNLSMFKIHSSAMNSRAEVRLKDTLGVGLGITYAF